jgi:pterin-4a-carbinolamine dehydratase
MSSSLDAATSSVCIPCSELNESALLSLDQVKAELKNMPLWSLHRNQQVAEQDGDGAATTTPTTPTSRSHCIRRHLVTKNFQAALDAINAIGVIAERENHHPDLHLIQYREVEIVIWTHKLGGITQNDIELANRIDAEVTTIQYSPKWLLAHPEVCSMRASS